MNQEERLDAAANAIFIESLRIEIKQLEATCAAQHDVLLEINDWDLNAEQLAIVQKGLLPTSGQSLLDTLERYRKALEAVNTQLNCPCRNTTETSHRRDGSVIISQDVRKQVADCITPPQEKEEK